MQTLLYLSQNGSRWLTPVAESVMPTSGRPTADLPEEGMGPVIGPEPSIWDQFRGNKPDYMGKSIPKEWIRSCPQAGQGMTCCSRGPAAGARSSWARSATGRPGAEARCSPFSGIRIVTWISVLPEIQPGTILPAPWLRWDRLRRSGPEVRGPGGGPRSIPPCWATTGSALWSGASAKPVALAIE